MRLALERAARYTPASAPLLTSGRFGASTETKAAGTEHTDPIEGDHEPWEFPSDASRMPGRVSAAPISR